MNSIKTVQTCMHAVLTSTIDEYLRYRREVIRHCLPVRPTAHLVRTLNSANRHTGTLDSDRVDKQRKRHRVRLVQYVGSQAIDAGADRHPSRSLSRRDSGTTRRRRPHLAFHTTRTTRGRLCRRILSRRHHLFRSISIRCARYPLSYSQRTVQGIIFDLSGACCSTCPLLWLGVCRWVMLMLIIGIANGLCFRVKERSQHFYTLPCPTKDFRCSYDGGRLVLSI